MPKGGMGRSPVAWRTSGSLAWMLRCWSALTTVPCLGAARVVAGVPAAAVADGYPLDAAPSEARQAIYTNVSEIEWATPVLYLRAPDGRIFDVAPPQPQPPHHPRPPPPKRQPRRPGGRPPNPLRLPAPPSRPPRRCAHAPPQMVKRAPHIPAPSTRGLLLKKSVFGVAFCPDGRWLATGIKENRAVLWRLTPPQHR
jgi:hypothetical protein